MLLKESDQQAVKELKVINNKINNLQKEKENIINSLKPLFLKSVLYMMDWKLNNIKSYELEKDILSGKITLEITLNSEYAIYLFEFKGMKEDKIIPILKFRQEF